MLSYVLLTITLGLLWLFLKKNDRKLPPGPVGLPIVGYIPFLQSNFTERQLYELSKKYGPVMSMRMGVYDCVVISDYQILKEFFAKNESSARPDLYAFKLFTEGDYPEAMSIASGHEWQILRRFVLRNLRDCGMGKSSIDDLMQIEVEDMSNKIKNSLKSPVQFGSIFDLATLNVISNVLTGERIEKLDDEFAREIQNLFDSEKYFTVLSFLSLLPSWLFYLVPSSFYGLKIIQRVIDWLREYSENHYDKAFNSYDDNHKRHFFDHFISEVLKQPKDDPDKSFSKKGMSSLFIELFSAGMQTTSVTMRYAIYYLTKYPEIQEKLYAEMERELGTSTRRHLSDKPMLPYMEAFLNELQRVADIVPLAVFHSTSDDVVLEGYNIPQGTIIIPNLYACHHDPKYWKDPHKFNPDRFFDDQGKLITSHDGLAPFSLGKRRCAGEAIARAELFLFTSNLVQEFTFHAPAGNEMFELKLVPGTVIHPEYPDVIVKLRNT